MHFLMSFQQHQCVSSVAPEHKSPSSGPESLQSAQLSPNGHFHTSIAYRRHKGFQIIMGTENRVEL